MPKYANQKTIKTEKEPCDKAHPYVSINLEALDNAVNLLHGETLRLWLYFAKNQNGYAFDLSPSHIVEEWSMSRTAVYRGIDELIECGFLEETPLGYTFHEKGSVPK